MNPSECCVSLVLSTAPDAEVGARIARSLVEESLAACVNVVPGVRSIYRWQGKVCDDAEVLLVAKVATAGVEALTRRIPELHPYEVPEVIHMEIRGGNEDYLKWVLEETGA